MAKVNVPRQPEAPPHDIYVDIAGFDPGAIERIDVNLRENEHDHVKFILGGINPLSVTEYVDLPVMVAVDVGYNDGFIFCGYINHVQPTHKAASGRANSSLFQEAWVHCLGASSHMRGKRTKMWDNFRVLRMVQDMSVGYNFSYSCPNNTPVIPRMAQRGESDWATLTQACTSSGLAVNVHGTEIHVWNPQTAVRYGAPSAVLESISVSGGVASKSPGRILEFEGSFGTAWSGDVNTKTMVLMDKDGGEHTVKSSDLYGTTGYGTALTSALTDTMAVEAQSPEDARRKLVADKAYSDAFTAKVTTTGVAGTIPGSVIGIVGFDSEFDGAWLVREMNMKFNRGHFISEFGLARSTTGSDYTGLPTLMAYDPAPLPKLSEVPLAGAHQRWVTTNRRTHEYSTN